jgi:hypothetical protein
MILSFTTDMVQGSYHCQLSGLNVREYPKWGGPRLSTKNNNTRARVRTSWCDPEIEIRIKTQQSCLSIWLLGPSTWNSYLNFEQSRQVRCRSEACVCAWVHEIKSASGVVLVVVEKAVSRQVSVGTQSQTRISLRNLRAPYPPLYPSDQIFSSIAVLAD